uniref:Uncharacterized protein n=1 Tax=Magallana gigas TaxID=29159 RepID=A0A8W8KPH4_MAGGI
MEKDCSELKGELPGGPLTTDELLPIIRNLKRMKAPGLNKITYEHIIFCGELATQVVVKLFNEIVIQDIGSPYLNPLTIAHIYKTVVIPSMLYGCKLWNNLSAKNTQRLHVFQHSVCKTAQTRSDICESLFGVYPISSEIDKRKLIFLG